MKKCCQEKRSMNHIRYDAVIFRKTCELIPICIFTDRGRALKRFARCLLTCNAILTSYPSFHTSCVLKFSGWLVWAKWKKKFHKSILIGVKALSISQYLTWLRGLQGKFRCFNLEFCLLPSLFWELKSKSTIKNKTAILSWRHWTHVRILIYRTCPFRTLWLDWILTTRQWPRTGLPTFASTVGLLCSQWNCTLFKGG